MTMADPVPDPCSPRPYSVSQLADRWDCSPSMIRKLIGAGRLTKFNIGVLIRISAAEVERFECQQNLTTASSDSGADLLLSGTDPEATATQPSSGTDDRLSRELYI